MNRDTHEATMVSGPDVSCGCNIALTRQLLSRVIQKLFPFLINSPT